VPPPPSPVCALSSTSRSLMRLPCLRPLGSNHHRCCFARRVSTATIHHRDVARSGGIDTMRRPQFRPHKPKGSAVFGAAENLASRSPSRTQDLASPSGCRMSGLGSNPCKTQMQTQHVTKLGRLCKAQRLHCCEASHGTDPVQRIRIIYMKRNETAAADRKRKRVSRHDGSDCTYVPYVPSTQQQEAREQAEDVLRSQHSSSTDPKQPYPISASGSSGSSGSGFAQCKHSGPWR
jgi:hypothetical protein